MGSAIASAPPCQSSTPPKTLRPKFRLYSAPLCVSFMPVLPIRGRILSGEGSPLPDCSGPNASTGFSMLPASGLNCTGFPAADAESALAFPSDTPSALSAASCTAASASRTSSTTAQYSPSSGGVPAGTSLRAIHVSPPSARFTISSAA